MKPLTRWQRLRNWLLDAISRRMPVWLADAGFRRVINVSMNYASEWNDLTLWELSERWEERR